MPDAATFRDVIAKWDKPADLADDIGKDAQAVAVWKHRDSIPPEFWPLVVAGATRRGFADVTLELLSQTYAAKRGVVSREDVAA